MESDLRILTVRQPWAGLIVDQLKSIENRTWPTMYRGIVAIHSAGMADWSDEAFAFLEHTMLMNRDEFSQRNHTCHRSQLIGVARIYSCIPYESENSNWRMPPPPGKRGWCWHLVERRRFAKPIAATGAQGLWKPDRLDPDARAMLERELERLGVATP